MILWGMCYLALEKACLSKHFDYRKGCMSPQWSTGLADCHERVLISVK